MCNGWLKCNEASTFYIVHETVSVFNYRISVRHSTEGDCLFTIPEIHPASSVGFTIRSEYYANINIFYEQKSHKNAFAPKKNWKQISAF